MSIRPHDAARAASAAALAALAVGGLASCSSPSGGADAVSSADASAVAEATGTWTATGDYQTPGGPESVTVTLSAKDGTVTAVKVTGSGRDANTRQYQSQFISGIQGEVVGKPLATLEVGAVSGSSLTGNGFDAAVDRIRSDAA